MWNHSVLGSPVYPFNLVCLRGLPMLTDTSLAHDGELLPNVQL